LLESSLAVSRTTQSIAVKLEEGGERAFLQDGDEITLRGWCHGEGYRVGFGECAGRILPARG